MDLKTSRVTFPPSTITGLSSHTGRHIQGLCFILKAIMVCALTHIKEPFIFSPLLLRSLGFPLFGRTYYASASSMRVQFGRCRGIMTNQRCSGATFHFGFAASLVSISVTPPTVQSSRSSLTTRTRFHLSHLLSQEALMRTKKHV